MISKADQVLGERIRTARKRRGKTMAQLAEAAGVTRSMISQIESARAQPSIRVLRLIAEDLAVPLFTLLADDDEFHEALVRREGRRELPLPGSMIKRELLVPDLNRRIVMLSATFAPGDVSADFPSSHAGEECVLVLCGTLTVEVGSTTFELREGDSYYLESKIPHRFLNNTNDLAKVVVAISPSLPTY